MTTSAPASASAFLALAAIVCCPFRSPVPAAAESRRTVPDIVALHRPGGLGFFCYRRKDIHPCHE
jgi:hypothetical protein